MNGGEKNEGGECVYLMTLNAEGEKEQRAMIRRRDVCRFSVADWVWSLVR
jgi:hypothetical protein